MLPFKHKINTKSYKNNKTCRNAQAGHFNAHIGPHLIIYKEHWVKVLVVSDTNLKVPARSANISVTFSLFNLYSCAYVDKFHVSKGWCVLTTADLHLVTPAKRKDYNLEPNYKTKK